MIGITTPVFGKAIYEKLLDLDIKKIVSMIDTSKKSTTKITSNGLYVLDDKKFKFLKNIILNQKIF